MEIVTVLKRKRPRGSGLWSGYLLGADDHGRWVFTPAHSTYLGSDGVENSSCEVSQDRDGVGRPSVVLLPEDRWFVAACVHGSDAVITADISTPPVRTGSGWAFDDLELDPFLMTDGTSGVEDEDEFEQAVEAGLMTSAERDAALAATAWFMSEITDPRSALIAAGRHWLDVGLAADLPPLPQPDVTGRP